MTVVDDGSPKNKTFKPIHLFSASAEKSRKEEVQALDLKTKNI